MGVLLPAPHTPDVNHKVIVLDRHLSEAMLHLYNESPLREDMKGQGATIVE